MIEIFFFMAIDILKDVGPITYNSFEMLAIGSPIATVLYGAWIFLIKWRLKQTINVVEQKAFSILYVIIFIPCAILLCISNTFKVFSFNIWGGGLDDQHARLFIVILSLSISSVLTIILLAFLLWLLAKYPAKTKLPPGLIEEIEKAKVDMHDIQILEKEMRNQRDSLGVKSKDIQEKLEMLKSQHQ